MRIFLTGASSYIGKYIISSLLINGHTVLSTSRRSPKIYSKSHKWFKHDLSKKTFKMGSFNPDMIIHLAGYAWMGHEPEKYVNSNILTTLNLVKSLKNKKFKKFFYLSTRDIYGEITDKELREDTRINNPDVYGHSKLIAEKILADSFPIPSLFLVHMVGSILY